MPDVRTPSLTRDIKALEVRNDLDGNMEYVRLDQVLAVVDNYNKYLNAIIVAAERR